MARLQQLAALLPKYVETVDFAVTGQLKRSDFAMATDRAFISNVVTLTIHVRIELPAPGDG